MSTSFERDFRRLKEQVEVLIGVRGDAGRPERAVRLKELGERQASSGTGQAITKVSQLENDKGYVNAAGAAAAAPIQEIQAGANISITYPEGPDKPRISSAGGGPPSIVLIGDVVTSGSQPVVTFNNIPQEYRHLELRILGRGTDASATVPAYIRFNGDTLSNYDTIRENRFGNVNYTTQPYINAFSVTGANAPAGTACAARIGIPGYASTTFHKSVEAISSVKEGNTNAGLYMQIGGGVWRNTAAIKRIDILMASGAFADGSIISLYGMK